ncbi:hypothetical protein FPOAC2_03679 [Fusarium poae]
MNRISKRRSNIRSDDWKIIRRHLDKRKDRQSTVYLNGKALSSEKVQRGVYRNFPTAIERIQPEPCPPLPEGITISTPPQSPTQPQSVTQPYDGMYTLPKDLPSFLLRTSVDSLKSRKAGGESNRPTTPSSTLEFVRSILPFEEREDFMSPDYTQTVCNELRKTMPERFEGELELIVNRLLEPNLDQIVGFAAERFINKQLSLEEVQRLLRLLETTGYDSYILFCLQARGTATKRLATAILGAALLNNNEHFVRIALDHGADPNCGVQGRTTLAIATQDPEKSQLVFLLVNAGARPGREDIHQVARRGDIGLVELLVPRAAWPDLGELVRIAARRGDLALFYSLIKLGVTRENWNIYPESEKPLSLALLEHHFEFARLLIDWEPPNGDHIPCLMLMIERGDILAVDFLIRHGVDINAVMRYTMDTALSLSIRKGKKDIIQLLLRSVTGVDGPCFVPQRETTGTDGVSIQTALEHAVRSGSIEMTQLLLSMGAKANRSDNTSFPLGLAVQKSPNLIPVLLRAGADMSNMFESTSSAWETSGATMLEVAVESAIKSGSLDVVEIVLRLGAPVNRVIPDHHMPSALQLAVTQDIEHKPLGKLSEALTVDLVKLLLQWGADFHIPEFLYRGLMRNNTRNYRDWALREAVGMTIVQSAAAQGRTALVRLLVSAGASCNAPAGKNGLTAIQAAAQFGDAEMVEYLIQSGADVNAPSVSKYDIPALVAAVAKGNLKSTSLLLEAGADANASGMVNRSGGSWKMTALQTAACQPESCTSSDNDPTLRLKMLKLLLNADANAQTPRFTDSMHDKTSLGWAVFWDDIDATKLLRNYGARLDPAERLTFEGYDNRGSSEIWYLLGKACCEDARRSRDTGSCRCDDFQSQMRITQDPPLFSATHAGNDISMHQLLEIGQDGFPCCIHSATSQGNLVKVNHLLDHGADVNAVCSKTYMQPLQIAARKGYVTIAHRLIQAGAIPAMALREAKLHARADICHLFGAEGFHI